MGRARTTLRKAQQEPVPVAPTPREVVRGITLTVSGRELMVRLGVRIRWHRERGDTLIEQMVKLAEVERSAAEDLANVLRRYESPRAVLERRLRQHQDRATFLAFVRDHIAVDAVYQLESADLKLIDVVPEPGYDS